MRYGTGMLSPLELLSYYDVLDRPLTKDELGTDLQHPSVKQREGYYYLFDREYLVPLRKRRMEFASRKWRIVESVASWLRHLPFIRIVFVSGSLSMNNTDEVSDLDVIIVAKHGRIWITRLLVSGLLALLGRRRRHEDHTAPNKICPNHFITDQALHIPFHSIYTAQLYANLVPLVGDADLLARFQKENIWVEAYVAHWNMPKTRWHSSWLQKLLEKLMPFANWLETITRNYQRARIVHRVSPLHPGGHVTYTDSALAFHAQSSEAEILQRYENSKSKFTHGL